MRYLAILALHAALFLLLLATCIQCQSQETPLKTLRPFQYSFIALQATDFALTQRGFATKQWQEHNLLMPQSSAQRAVYFAGTGALMLVTSELLVRKNHRKWALVLLVTANCVETYAVQHSARGLRR